MMEGSVTEVLPDVGGVLLSSLNVLCAGCAMQVHSMCPLLVQALSSGLAHSAIEALGLGLSEKERERTRDRDIDPVILTHTVAVCCCSSDCPELSLVGKKGLVP